MEYNVRPSIEFDMVYVVDIVCSEHGKVASSVPPSEVADLSVAHRENKGCFAHIEVKLVTDKNMVRLVKKR